MAARTTQKWVPADDDKESFKFAKLGNGSDETNWRNWSFLMEIALKNADAWGAVTPNTADPDYTDRPQGGEELEILLARSRWAYQKIALRVGRECMSRVQSVARDDARSAWTALARMLESASNVSSANILYRLANLRANDTNEILDFVTKHNELAADAGRANFTMYRPERPESNALYNLHIAGGLPETWKDWRTAITGREGLTMPPLEFLDLIKGEFEIRAKACFARRHLSGVWRRQTEVPGASKLSGVHVWVWRARQRQTLPDLPDARQTSCLASGTCLGPIL